MSEDFELSCSVREDLGKGASRRLRRLNQSIPAILYGGDEKPTSLTIAHKDIAKATENEAFFSQIITLKVGKKKEKAVIKALQRHPAKPFILHADFLRVSDKQAITVRVPIHFLNEDKCSGVKIGGGNILKTLNEIEVSCLPKDLPEYIEVDMLDVELGESVHLSDITLPDGVISVALSVGTADEDEKVDSGEDDAAEEQAESKDSQDNDASDGD